MQKTILIARNRTTGKDEILAGSETDFAAQRDAYFEFDSPINEEYSEVALFNLVPVKKPLRLITQAEADRRAETHEERLAAAGATVVTKNVADAKQALTDAEEGQKAAVEKYQAAKRAFGICQDPAQKLGLKSKLDAAKQAARQAITALETARQEYHRSLTAPVIATPSAETKKPEPTAGDRREAELLALTRAELLALMETFKSEGKAVDTGGKSKKSDLVNAILKTEGFTITAPETAE